jgi:hypothetical protein
MMLGQLVRVAGGVLVGVLVGAVPAALYAGLVGAVHVSIYGRSDGVPAFISGCVLVGAVLGLLGYIACALSGSAGRQSASHRAPPGVSRLLESARCTADAIERRRGREPGLIWCHHCGDRTRNRPGTLSGLYRSFETRN